MEEIKSYLLNGEEIIWQNIETLKDNAIRRYSGLLIFSIIAVLLPVFLGLIPVINTIITPIITIIIVPVGIFMIVLIIIMFLFEKLTKDKAQLTWKDLQNYEMILSLSNKRLIQRDLGIVSFNLKNYTKNEITRMKDFLFIKLDLIKCIEFDEFKHKNRSDYYSTIYFNYEKSEPKKIMLGGKFQDEMIYRSFNEKIRKLLQVKREESKEAGNHKRTNLYF